VFTMRFTSRLYIKRSGAAGRGRGEARWQATRKRVAAIGKLRNPRRERDCATRDRAVPFPFSIEKRRTSSVRPDVASSMTSPGAIAARRAERDDSTDERRTDAEGDSGRLIGSFSRVERRNEAWPNYFRSPAHCHVLTALFSSATQPFLVIVNDPARTWPVTSISEHAGMVCYLRKIVTYLGTPDRPRNRCPASGLEKSSWGKRNGYLYSRRNDTRPEERDPSSWRISRLRLWDPSQSD